MKVAFISVVPSPYQRDLFRALAQRPEVNLQVFYLEAAAPDSPPAGKGSRTMRANPARFLVFDRFRALPREPAALPGLNEYDVIVMNTLMSFTGQWLMRTTLRRKRWMFWGERLGRGGALHERLTAPLHRAAAIASIGSMAEEDYRARFPEPQHFRIPYYCELDTFLATPRRTRPDGQVVFLFCGQMIARKGIDVLLEAFPRLGDSARLLLVGREAELPQLLAGLAAPVRERITYAGFQAPEALPEYFAQADVFVLPSRYDGWGVVINQALGAGLAIICSDQVGAGRGLVEDEVNGLAFSGGR